MQQSTTSGNGTTLISAGTTLKGDISSTSDLRIDGTIVGNIHSSAKIVIGTNGIVEGDISGNQADIVGKVSGNIRTKELLQLRGECIVTGNIYAGLWYPMIVASITFIVGSIFLKETRHVRIWDEVRGADPAGAPAVDIDGPA